MDATLFGLRVDCPGDSTRALGDCVASLLPVFVLTEVDDLCLLVLEADRRVPVSGLAGSGK